MSITIPRLYAILDAAQLGERQPITVAEILLQAGVRLIQYRDKSSSSRQLFVAGRRVVGRAREGGAIFIVNDRADVARALDADGVHLGQEDLPIESARLLLPAGKWVGCSTHTLAQVREADRTSADYIAFGPVFPTRSKATPDPVVGLQGLSEARKATDKPLVAIGGITLQDVQGVIGAGADSVAVIGDLLQAPDIGVRAREFLTALG
jgi:thiamine-phosphate pyrophosphorylase